ncbi:ATP-dependent DNA ligase [Pseudarthrobacter phenanthrenivorans]|uniref:DNA ligase n=1 Tax=Pseudarthrobacter phenanthrenivorans TaxID=361575 RepID=A0A0B4DIR9_PSEPS|nr:ATP-dependent DNA ligase [Pseudarthrobacter phenanthrenivorans]KIC68722.1 DNA ligase [Pseudarthrobacter phenanthrenivorans]
MREDIPAALRPPVSLALAKGADLVPAVGGLPGGCMYEPKWDGFRSVILAGADGVSLWSRQGRDLSKYFPDLVEAAAAQLPPGCVLDGEAVIWTDDQLDFDVLQRRLVTSRAALPGLIQEHPASFAAFDLLAVAGHDIRGLPLAERRELLEQLAADWEPPLNLSPVTTDRDEALKWFEELYHAGLEGLVVKGAGQPYQGAVRQWIKVKRRESVDVVCAAVIGPIARPQYIVVGLPVEGRLRIVGRSAPLAAKASRKLAAYLQPPVGAHPWPEVITETMLNRFSKDKGPIALTLVEPLVVEISADTAWTGNAFRHSVRYQRPRPELATTDVQLPDR